MTARLGAAATAAAALLLTVTAAPATAAAPTAPSVHLVHPGESVQAAVDAAAPGEVVELAAGTYPGSVTVSTDRLILRGQGAATVLTPDPADTSACARAGHGLCVVGDVSGPVRGVSVESLTLTGFTKNGLNASGTDALTVRGVLSHHNGQQGISQERSTRAVLVGNESRDNGQAGIFVANSVDQEGGAIDTLGTEIAGNRLTGNRIGVVLRRTRDMTVEGNRISDNCGGVFVVGDEGVPRAGALEVRANVVTGNNRYCAPNPRLDFIQGTGILLTGTEDTRVVGNTVGDNSGSSPMSGGIVLYRSLVGAPNARATVTGNLLWNNGPADLADRDTGAGNVFSANTCRVSQPAGHC
ncbi:right-handed parallel beta-helix repeat-containing protein [Kitasatospora paracochleata]|uniref:Parallel beta-helix repeat protein n=1 Tax=Kitasatospora paracochleata TaxID=58354 RepID=A0ABT1J7V2_9ACTN|nr:right-handed parallel beta-helix repeat-containing protein [Kitasatospora paracochleata]MCP2313522.1 parallel beta-helix repeat protein [Kitasatospora paracochleata]